MRTATQLPKPTPDAQRLRPVLLNSSIMAGSTFGTLFRVSTWGESHGPAVGCVVDGCPSGIPITEEMIQRDLDLEESRLEV